MNNINTVLESNRARICRTSLAYFAACGVLSMGLLQPTISHAQENSGCKAAELSGESFVDPSTGAFVGTGNLSLGSKANDVSWVSVISSFVANEDGTLTITSSHHITSTGNRSIDFVTGDSVSATPTDVAGQYLFTSHLTIANGTGEIGSGSLEVTGWVDLYAGHVVLTSSHGSLCAKR